MTAKQAAALIVLALVWAAAQAKLVTLVVPEPAPRLVNKQAPPRAEPSKEVRLIQQATAGERDAQVELGVRYFDGSGGLTQNVQLALKWFLLAANEGDRRGALGAGAVYMLYGESPVQLRDGLHWLRVASDAGLARAHYIEALALWRKAGARRLAALDEALALGAKGGDAYSINMQGALLERDGKRRQALEFYRRAATLGSPAAAANIARLQDSTQFALYRSNPAAFDESQLTAEEAYDFARRYHAGRGVPADYTRAISLYELSARARYAPAQKMLALIYSRRAPNGGLDPAWMQALAATDPRNNGTIAITSLGDDGLPAIDDRPLADLLGPATSVSSDAEKKKAAAEKKKPTKPRPRPHAEPQAKQQVKPPTEPPSQRP